MSQNPEVLKVIGKDIRTSTHANTNGKKYAYLTFEGNNQKAVTLPSGLVVNATTKGETGAMIAWESNNLPTPTQDFGWNFKVGEYVLGAKVTRTVPDYPITDKATGNVNMVNTYSAIVLGDTTNPSFETEVRRVFKSAGHNLDYADAVALADVQEFAQADMRGQ